ncbi:MAG: DUF4390 domain-containing protein [Kangiellaceae bacterium]|nr:DUF4390 domain-containing protein [Kangiellaceae bacterium]
MLDLIKLVFAKIIIVSLLAMPSAVYAAGITFTNFKLMGDVPKYKVLTGVEFDLTSYLQSALENGVALKARVQFRLIEDQAWWFNNESTLLTIHYQLKYHALSQHYLLTRNDTNEHWNFSTLSAALRKLGELRQYQLPDIPPPLDDSNYSILAVADMEPETLRLPLRVQSFFSNKYRLSSEGVLWPLR